MAATPSKKVATPKAQTPMEVDPPTRTPTPTKVTPKIVFVVSLKN